jgi:predicted AlkP superfamily pyrophosphatase or phosphodiesterase
MQEAFRLLLMRNYRPRFLGILLVLVLVLPAFAADRINDLRPTVILVSLDGFRSDYLGRIATPNLHAIMDRGVHAKYMIPSFPTKTFPNHYTIATGLYPAHHGIIANYMYDPDLNEKFNKNDPKASTDARWWGGEPIWVTAEKQGLRTAPLMWPGAMVARAGIRPTFTQAYDKQATPDDRVDKLVSLLDLPVNERPQLLTLYIDVVDQAGHDFGPRSQQVAEAVQQSDRAIGRLLSALKERGIEDQVNLIVVSDHGMSPQSLKKTVFLDDYIEMDSVDVIDGTPVVTLRPKDGNYDTLYTKLKRVPHAKAYRASEVPERWHFSGSHRIPPVFLLADDEWTITTHEYLKGHKLELGNHGFDNTSKNMRALFMAAGPAFQQGTMKPFANVHLYSLFAYLLNISPAQTDGSIDVFKSVLVQRTQTEPSKKILAPWQKEWDEVAENRSLVVNR